MFPLRVRKDGGYNFNQDVDYSVNPHRGQDYVARYVDYYAPFDGIASAGKTAGGGKFWQLTRYNGDVLIARHLNKVYKIGPVKEGDLAAQTGNDGAYTTGPHLHQEVKVNGQYVDPEKYNWSSIQYPMTLKVQLVFNNQKYGNEVGLLGQAKARMDSLSGSKATYSFYAPIYTTHQNIPSKVYLDAAGAFDQAADKDWFIDNLCELNREADIIVLVGKKGDWEASYGNQITYGHYYSELPATFPALIQIVAEENDVSWKWPELNAFVHYLTHETSHPLQQMAGPDRTHEFDYKSVNGLSEILPNLNYENINYQLTHKVSYEGIKAVFLKRDNDPTIYLEVAGKLLPFAGSYENFLKDFPNSEVVAVPPNALLEVPEVKFLVIKDR